MVDPVTLTVLALGGFFVALSIVLLSRYASISRQLSSSTDVSKALWDAVQNRLNKQDERIIDVLTRLDVLQSRILGAKQATQSVAGETTSLARVFKGEGTTEVPSSGEIKRDAKLDGIEEIIIRALNEKPRTSTEIKSIINKSREHTARLMKGLYDRGLVSRDDSTRPFVYGLTEEGKRYLSLEQ